MHHKLWITPGLPGPRVDVAASQRLETCPVGPWDVFQSPPQWKKIQVQKLV